MKIQNSFSWGAGSAMARALLGLAMISGFSACSLPQRFAEAITHNRPIFSPRTELATAAPTVPTVASKQQQVAIADKTTVKSDKKSNDTRSSLYAWDGDDVPGRVSVTIDLSEQKARIYRGGRNVGWTYVATGKQGHRTPTGTFAIREKVRNKTSNSWGVVVNKSGQTVNRDAKNGRAAVPRGGRFVGATMPCWMRVTGGIGMHAGIIPNPGSPASHGCIRLPRYMASKLFEVSSVGSSVRIVP
jgi:lipoprotein-anchoring transpeptidase ErfK/SrfK